MNSTSPVIISAREPVMREMEGGHRPTGISPITGMNQQPADPEVAEVVKRRKHTAAYKLRILAEADACTEQGQLGALLRREGLYHSNLTTWRRQRQEGILQGLSQKRGRKKKSVNPLAKRLEELERENNRLQKKLSQAELIIEFQKKISEFLGIQSNQKAENHS
jgi:transposase